MPLVVRHHSHVLSVMPNSHLPFPISLRKLSPTASHLKRITTTSIAAPMHFAPTSPHVPASPITSTSSLPRTSCPRESTLHLDFATALDGNADERSDPQRNLSRIFVTVYDFPHHLQYHCHKQFHQRLPSQQDGTQLTGSATTRHSPNIRGNAATL